MTITTSIISLTMEFLCIYIMVKSYTEVSLIPQKADLLFGIAMILFNCFLPDSYGALLWLLGQLIYLFYILSQYSGTLLERIFLFILSMISMLIVQCICAVPVSLMNFPSDAWFMPLVGNGITLLLIIIFFRFTPAYKLYSMLIVSAFPLRFIMLNTYVIFMAALVMTKLNIINLYQKSIYFLVLAVFLVSSNACLLYYEQQLKFRQKELASYQKNLPIYKTLIDQIRASQHEYSNHIQTLQALPQTCADYDSLCNALAYYSKEYSTPLHAYTLLKINMPLLAASLYNLYSRACDKGISMLFDITTTTLQSTVPEHILTDFVCILTQNAIEASKKGDSIYIYLYSQDGKTHFEIRNPSDEFYTPEQLSQFFQKGYTTKTKKDDTTHGDGLYHLLSSINKLHGEIGADCIEHHDKYWIIFQLEI